MKRFSLSKNKRLVSNSQFQHILSRGCSARDNLLILYVVENDCDYARIGVSIGKAHGNAIIRNRLKRLLKEVFRQNQDKIAPGYDYLLMRVRRKDTKGEVPTFEQVKSSFLSLLKSLGKIVESDEV